MWLVLLVFPLLSGCDDLRALVVKYYPQDYQAGAAEAAVKGEWPSGFPAFSAGDENRKQIGVTLTPVAAGLAQPTDIQFAPGQSHNAVVLEKGGRALLVDLSSGEKKTLFEVEVLTKSEQGLLGFAFHPGFVENGRVFLHRSVKDKGRNMGRIEEWYMDPTQWRARQVRTVIEVQQPFANHDGGQIAFGPDGRLYIGLGDGGWRNDPNGHGQNGATWLGSMLRIDVDGGRDAAYTVPASNPWVNDDSVADEAWAIGLRNPWRFSFAPDGRMIVADVGQNAWEEIDIVAAGDNLGWNTREGRHCLEPDSGCEQGSMVDPIYEYGRDEGKSVTGGYVYTGSRVPALKDLYVFGDFVSGRLWAIPLPEDRTGPLVQAAALGQWPFLPSTFGRAADGELYVAGFGKGVIYRIDPI